MLPLTLMLCVQPICYNIPELLVYVDKKSSFSISYTVGLSIGIYAQISSS